LGNRLAESRHLLLDAPISGGTGGAEGATLTVMASGAQSAYRAAEAALKAIASRVYDLGKEPGISFSDQ
jgi:L-threonate 2-dehydrogenase